MPNPPIHEKEERLRPTSLDATIAALSPALIIGMICCLVFFLVIVVYRGDFSQRLMYILGLYTMAIVLVARIAIEQSRTVAFGYTLLLGGATLMVTLRFASLPPSLSFLNLPFVVGLLILIGYLADRITFDCTLIDEDKDTSGVGLLQSLGILYDPTRLPPKTSQKNVISEREDDPQILVKGTKERRHNPGVWVLYFALLAIPLFGLGQLCIPGDDSQSRRFAFLCLIGYLWFAMSLLVVTSFLGMRRYLRKRRVEMSPGLNMIWIAGGMAGVLSILLFVCLLPLPSGAYGVWDFPIQLGTTAALRPSRMGWGQEGIEQKGEHRLEKVDANVKEPAKARSEGESNTNHAHHDGKKWQEGKDAEAKQAAKSESSKSSTSSSSPATHATAKNPPETESKSGREAKDSGKQPDRQDKRQQDGPKEGQVPPQAPSSTPMMPLLLVGGISNLLRWLFIGILAVVIAYWVVQFRAELRQSWREFSAWLRRLFHPDQVSKVETMRTPFANASTSEAVGPKLFLDYENPFEHTSRSWTPPQIIQQSFEAMEAWGRERKLVRAERETPHEFMQRIVKSFPDQKESIHRMAALYHRLAYAGGNATLQEVQPLRDLWTWMRRSAGYVLIFAGFLVCGHLQADEAAAIPHAFWIRNWDVMTAKPPQTEYPAEVVIERQATLKRLFAEINREGSTELESIIAANELYREICRNYWEGNGALGNASILPDRLTQPSKLDIQSRVARPQTELGWPAGYTVVMSPHFQVTTQASSQLAIEVVRLCEQTYAVWQQLFFDAWCDAPTLAASIKARRTLVEPQGEARFQVILFRDRDSYLKQLSRIEVNVAVSTGYYNPKAKKVFCYWDTTTSEATLRHELTHQFFHIGSRFDVSDPSQLSSDFWIFEGLALFMESLRIEKQRGYDIATIGGWDAVRLQPARYRRLHDQTWIDWNEFRGADSQAFRSGDAIKLWYSQAAGLTHLWMEHSVESRARFWQYARTVLTGIPEPSRLDAWNHDETLRNQYDLALLKPGNSAGWMPTSSKLRDVVLSRCEVDSDVMLAWPESNRRLEWLDLSFTSIDDRMFQLDVSSQVAWDVRRLNIESTRVTDEGLAPIARMPRLEELDLSRCAVSDQGLQNLRGNRTIKILWLTGVEKITDASLEILKTLPRLETVDIAGTRISPAGWEGLLKQSPKLRGKR